MILKTLSLQHFRNYSKIDFTFSDTVTIIVARNGAGKSNLIEAVYLLATGKSFRASPPAGGEMQLIQFEKKICRVVGVASASNAADANATEDEQKLEVVFADQGTPFLKKKYLVNGIARRRADFAGHLTAVLFTPMDLDLVSGQPGNRRRFLDDVLEQVDIDYRIAHTTYTKALRQRNALLEKVQETGRRDEKLFSYWDSLLIKCGNVITSKREELISFINNRKKDYFDCMLNYDKSTISEQRLEQYKTAEIGAGVTLVGPHRDDIQFRISNSKFLISNDAEARYFASRGQQRLIVLEMKLAQIAFLSERRKVQPLLILDDIFSELDSQNIKKILKLIDHSQVIITTTHREFVKEIGLKDVKMIELQ